MKWLTIKTYGSLQCGAHTFLSMKLDYGRVDRVVATQYLNLLSWLFLERRGGLRLYRICERNSVQFLHIVHYYEYSGNPNLTLNSYVHRKHIHSHT